MSQVLHQQDYTPSHRVLRDAHVARRADWGAKAAKVAPKRVAPTLVPTIDPVVETVPAVEPKKTIMWLVDPRCECCRPQPIDEIPVRRNKIPFLRGDIVRLVAREFDVTIRDIKGPCRKREFTDPRQVAMYLMRTTTKMSLPQIARYIGDRDHTTALHAVRKIAAQILAEPELARRAAALRTKIEMMQRGDA